MNGKFLWLIEIERKATILMNKKKLLFDTAALGAG